MTDIPPLVVTRLLQNPLGGVAPDGARGDIVRVSDGRTTVYLTPAEFDVTGEPEIRAQLAAAALGRV